MNKVLTPHAAKSCSLCSGTGIVGGNPCACRFEEPCSTFWARMGQADGWCTTRDSSSLIFVGKKI